MSLKVLMVCLGNICRSPLAEGILQHKVNQKNLGWEVDSAGTGSWHIGSIPHAMSVKVAAKNGIDITSQRGRQFSRNDFAAFDYILVMDSQNKRDVLSLATTDAERSKVHLLLDFMPGSLGQSVPDPYGNPEKAFDTVFALVDTAVDHFLNAVQAK